MKRTALTLTLALFFGFIGMAWSQVPAQRVIIVDTTGGHAATVSGGNLGTSASVTVDNIQHITSATHVVGTVSATQSGAFNVSAAQSGSLTIQAAHQGGEWNIRHISGSLHVAGISNVGSGTTAATTPMVCHSTSAFSTTADAVIAHANSGMRIYVCSIVLVAAGAESVSLVEGSGSTCGTAKMGVIGGTGGTMALAANGGFSSISPFPWVSSSVVGNAVCLDKSGSGNVSGVITYRGAP